MNDEDVWVVLAFDQELGARVVAVVESEYDAECVMDSRSFAAIPEPWVASVVRVKIGEVYPAPEIA